MGVLSWTIETTGLEGISPKLIFINTNDTFLTITTPGYLLLAVESGMVFTNGAMALVQSTSGALWLQTSLVNGLYSLVPPANTSTVLPPTAANQIAIFTDNIGTITKAATLAICEGNIQAGSSGTAGSLISYPGRASSGYLKLTAVNDPGNHVSTISNTTSLGQNTVYKLPDPGVSIARFMLDSGVTAMAVGSDIILDKSAATTVSFAVTINKNSGVITTEPLSTASGASQIIILTNSLITSSSVILCQLQDGTNTVKNISLFSIPRNGSAKITIHNNAATALNGTLIIGFAVF